MDDASSFSGGDSERGNQMGINTYDVKRDWGRSSFDATQNFVVSYTYPLPFQFEGGAASVLLNGWEFNGIVTLTTGAPFSVLVDEDLDFNGDKGRGDRPNLVPGAILNPTEGVSAGCGDGTIGAGAVGRSVSAFNKSTRWYDPCAFSVDARVLVPGEDPGTGIPGNVGRNTLLGPGKANVDFSVNKNFSLGETFNLQLRTEVFNILNRNNLGLPDNTGFAGGGAYAENAGLIRPGRTVTRPREIQFGLKLIF